MAEVICLDVETIQERLKEVLQLLDPKPSQVSKKTGLIYDTVYQIMEKEIKTAPSATTLGAIIKAYPQINANYILTGEGLPILNLNTDPIHPLLTQANRALNELNP